MQVVVIHGLSIFSANMAVSKIAYIAAPNNN